MKFCRVMVIPLASIPKSEVPLEFFVAGRHPAKNGTARRIAAKRLAKLVRQLRCMVCSFLLDYGCSASQE
jgi:hypothetical protein